MKGQLTPLSIPTRKEWRKEDVRCFEDRRAGAECVARQSLQRKRAVFDVAATGDLHQGGANLLPTFARGSS